MDEPEQVPEALPETAHQRPEHKPQEPMAWDFAVIGAGAVGTNLSLALLEAGHTPRQIISRTQRSAKALKAKLEARMPGISTFTDTKLERLLHGLDFIFLTVKDDQLTELIDQLAGNTGTTLIMHCSGGQPLSILEPLGEQVGVLWPMQALTRDRPIDLHTAPLFIEGTNDSYERVRSIARELSSRVRTLNSEHRLQLHAGAVFAANFVNHMLACAQELLPSSARLDHKVYLPLLQEAVEKLHELSPHDAQTGPARRGDQVVVGKHLELLQRKNPALAELYDLLSRRIASNYGQELPEAEEVTEQELG